MDLDLTLLVQLGLFLFLMAVLHQLLWKPYLRVRAERVSRVEGFREEASRMEAEAAARLARTEAALADARRLGSVERSRARAEAQAREQILLAEAQTAAQRQLAQARGRLEASMAAERGKLEAEVLQIAREASRKILGRDVGA